VSSSGRLDAVRLALAFSGDAEGPLERLIMTGGGTLGVEAGALSGAVAADAPRVTLSARGFSLARSPQGARFALQAELSGGAAALSAGESAHRTVAFQAGSARLEGVLTEGGLRLAGAPNLTATAAQAQSGAWTGQGFSLAASSSDMTLEDGEGGWRGVGLLETRAALNRLASGDFAVSAVTLEGRGQGQIGGGATAVSWRGAARSQPGISAAQARTLADAFAVASRDPDALARALQTLRLDAPDIRVDMRGETLRLALGAPARLVGEGAIAVLSPRAGLVAATMSPEGFSGAVRLSASGAAIPTLVLDMPSYRLGPAGLSAEARLSVSELDIGPVAAMKLQVDGAIVPRDGGSAFVARECADVEAERIMGEDALLASDLKARVCPDAGRPLFASTARGWSAHARVEEANVQADTAGLAVADTEAVIDVSGGPAGLTGGAVDVIATTIVDKAAETRFRSVFASGALRLREQAWVGALTLADAERKRRLGEVAITHSMTTGRGSAEIDAGDMVFAGGAGLQPMDISPIAIGMITEAEGPASFTGRVVWGPDGVTSSGRVATSGLDFTSSVGRISGMKGAIVFTSLAPLTTEVDQELSIDHVDWLVPLDDARIRLSLTTEEIKVTRAEVQLGGGKVVLDPLDLKLGALLPTSGTLRLTGVDINNLLSNFDLADKVSIEAVVDGVVPFAFTPDGLRFADGKLFATGPGRLSIKRQALSGVSADDGAATTAPNAMTSFAYQAMENLAFSQLDAGVNSLPAGRLGVIFHLQGSHDPPVAQRARISLFDLLRGKAFEKDIPLPSGTPVELTLDTTLNFDELMAAYSEAGRSTPVQP